MDPKNVPFVAVIGLHRSGSSCLAGVLHHLGVYMGDQLGGYESAGGFEAFRLASLCEAAYPFPATESVLTHDDIVAHLRSHISEVCASASRRSLQMAGGKYPHLCAMGTELQEACCGPLRIIHIERPLDQSINSLVRRSRLATGWLAIDDDKADAVQRWLWDRKQEFLQTTPHLTVLFEDLVADPRREIEQIVAWLSLSVESDAIDRAVAHVQPQGTS